MTAVHRFIDWVRAQPHGPELGAAIPDASGPLAPLFRVVDGQASGPDLVLWHALLSQEEARAEKRAMDELAIAEGWDETWWSPDWHPFASDGAGQLLVVEGSSGRVLAFVHDDDVREELASDLDTLFGELTGDLEAGRRVYDEAAGVVTPEEARAWHARPPPPSPRSEVSRRPTATLALIMIPAFTWFAIGAGFQLGAEVTVFGMLGIVFAMMGLAWGLGWWTP